MLNYSSFNQKAIHTSCCNFLAEFRQRFDFPDSYKMLLRKRIAARANFTQTKTALNELLTVFISPYQKKYSKQI